MSTKVPQPPPDDGRTAHPSAPPPSKKIKGSRMFETSRTESPEIPPAPPPVPEKCWTNAEKEVLYHRAAHSQHATDGGHRPLYVPSYIRLPRRVHGDFPFGHTSQLGPGDYPCTCNQWGAVSVIAEDGQMLGIKLYEFVALRWEKNPHITD